MKASLSFLFILLSLSAAFSQEIPINSQIDRVKVYQTGAEIFRSFKTGLNKGSSTVVIEELSSTLNPSSIQVKLNPEVTLVNVSHRLNYLGSKKFNEKIRSLKDSLETVDFALKETKAMIHALNEEESFIVQNKSIAGEDAVLNLSALKEISTYARVRIHEIHVQLIQERKDESKLQKRYNRLNQQLSELNAKQKRPYSEIVLEVLCDNAQPATFELSYFVNQASWIPAYDLRSPSIEDPVQLVYKARVTQNTGIDWEDVNLIISTANPTADQSRPILNPWFIDFITYYQTQSIRYKDKNLGLSEGLMMESDNEENKSLDYGGVQQYTTLQLNQLNEEFQISLKFDIPSDNKAHTVNMKDFELPAKYQYHAVPKLDNDAFLLAKVTEWGDISLLPGEASLFFDNSFVGKSFINPNVTSDTLLLSFGRDKRIIIEREQIKDYESKTFLGINKKETFTYKITVRNTKNQEVSIEVIDQIPVSKNKEIEVKLEESSDAVYTEEYGKLKWKFSLPPDGVRELKFVYSVKYPKDKVIPGL